MSTDVPARRRHRAVRIGWLTAIASTCLIVSSTLAGAGAGAAPGTASSTNVAVDPVAVVSPDRASGAGAGIPSPPSANEDYGIHFDPISTRVRKAKVAFDLPPLVLRSYLQVCILSGSFSTPCPGHKLSRYPKLPFPYTWDVAFARNWVATRVGGTLRFGQFPPVRVSMLGFGALPVTATAHLTQTITKGVYDPLSLHFALDISPVPPGRAVPGFGPAPRYPGGVTFFNYRPVSTGTVDIRLSNVSVDRVPLPVGTDCHTAAPAALRLAAPAGYYPQSKSPTQLKGRPGEFQPLSGGPAGYLQGAVDVPAFTGCHNGADNLNRLITGMISGTDNPVTAYSPAGLQSWCLEAVAHCSSATSATQRTLLAAASGKRPLTPRTVAALSAADGAYRAPSPR